MRLDCPNCGAKGDSRKTKTPMWRCSPAPSNGGCGYEWDDPKYTAVMVHLGLMLDDRGYSLQTISAVVATYTGTNAVFLMIGGYVGDRIPIRFAAFGFSCIQAVALLILIASESVSMVFLFAVVLGVGVGGRNPVTSAIRGIYFGRKAFATILGISMVPMNILLFCAPLYVGYIRDMTGNYDVGFLTVAVVCFVGSLFFLLL